MGYDGRGDMRVPLGGWPSHKQRHTATPFMHADLASTHPGIVDLYPGRPTVVGEEEHDGILRETELIKLREESPTLSSMFSHMP